MGINKTNKIKQMEGAEETKIDTISGAIKNVIKKSMAVDGCVKGLNQVGKALDRKDAYLCILAKDCDDPKYKKLITALAKQNKIPLITTGVKRNNLGEWTGQCKYEKGDGKDKDLGKARKIRGCSSLCIRDYGQDSSEKTTIEQYIKDNNL